MFFPWLEVLVDHPGAQGLYCYRLPDHLSPEPGDILTVPFGVQQVGAIAIRRLEQPPAHVDPGKIRSVEDVVGSGLFSPHYWQLLERVADYYQTPLMQVLKTALPPGLLAKSQCRIRLAPPRDDVLPDQLSPSAQRVLKQLQGSATGDYTWRYLRKQTQASRRDLQDLRQQGWVESYWEPPSPPRPKLKQAVALTGLSLRQDYPLTSRQQEVLTVLQRYGGDLWLSDALQRCRTTSATLRKLADLGHVVIEPREVLRVPQAPCRQPDRAKVLTPAQQSALGQLLPLHSYTQVLLHGVTGSGKTEVYLQAIAPRLAAGQSVLVLVPEIGLTPQLTDRFRDRFGQQVQVYHSALADGERYDTWRQMLKGEAQVVIGTRSAVFVPLSNLGLIILDEEHDSSFKQDQPAPCYHARTVANWRAQLADIPLVLGSATPSLESWMRTHPQQPHPQQPHPHPTLYLELPERINTRPMPMMQVVDMRQELHRGNRSIFSRQLQTALTAMKDAGNQGLLFIHRRGHSRFVSCRSCGHVMDCPHCDVSLSHHKPYAAAMPTLRCHYCGYGQAQPMHCPACGSPYLKHFGSGTQRVVNELTEQFPDLRCIRFDSDTTRRKGSHRTLIERFAQGEADLLVGTQMLTKGLDLPQVTLVGILAADGLLYMSDYWASERAYQTLTQVAGRSGRGDRPGQVIMQTYTPDHPVIDALIQQDYPAFMAEEIAQRQGLAYPPWGQVVLLRVSGLEATQVEQTAASLAEAIATRLDQTPTLAYDLLGPAPAPILRVAQRYRWHILLKLPYPAHAPAPFPMNRLPDLTDLRDRCPAGVSLTIDVDALNLS